jgi:hypothetical protein
MTAPVEQAGAIDLAPGIAGIAPDEGIEIALGIFNSKGLVTTLSCAGHTDTARSHAWFRFEAAHFKGYMLRNPEKMNRFLLAGEGIWTLSLEYFAQSRFQGLGARRPRLKRMRRVLTVELDVTLVVHGQALERDGRKTKVMHALERAARQCL